MFFVNSSFYWWFGAYRFKSGARFARSYLLERHEEAGWGTHFRLVKMWRHSLHMGVAPPWYVFRKFVQKGRLGLMGSSAEFACQPFPQKHESPPLLAGFSLYFQFSS
jgi:hypothetical protein